MIIYYVRYYNLEIITFNTVAKLLEKIAIVGYSNFCLYSMITCHKNIFYITNENIIYITNTKLNKKGL